MKIYWPIAVSILLAAFALASPGFSVPLSEMDLDWFREKPLDTEWGPDPFVSKVPISAGGKASADPETSFLLTAVLLGSEKPAAVLNGSVVHVGDRIQGHRVTRITKKSIFLKGPSGTAEILLKPLFSIEGKTP